MEQVVVIDNGSGTTKAGISGEHLPKAIFPTVIGHLKYRSAIFSNDTPFYAGEEALAKKGVCQLKYPIENGIVKNWEVMENLWLHTYANELRMPSDEHPVLLTEPSMNPKANKEKMAEIMFESFNVPKMYIGVQAVLSLYSSALTSGAVLDIGEGVSHIVPIYEGYPQNHAVNRLDLAGRDVTKRLQDLLFMNGIRLITSSDLETCKEIKEKCCYVAYDYEKESKKNEDDLFSFYELPDGNTIHLGHCKFEAPEILFNPSLIGKDLGGVQEALWESIGKCDMDIRKVLIGNIVMSGGSTLISGFVERIRKEIQDKIPGKAKVEVLAPEERRFSVWIGGSILASLDSFQSLMVTSEEYCEHGAEIVHNKF